MTSFEWSTLNEYHMGDVGREIIQKYVHSIPICCRFHIVISLGIRINLLRQRNRHFTTILCYLYYMNTKQLPGHKKYQESRHKDTQTELSYYLKVRPPLRPRNMYIYVSSSGSLLRVNVNIW